MAPPALLRYCVDVSARCSTATISIPFARYSSTSDAIISGTPPPAAYSCASFSQRGWPSRKVPAPNTLCPGRGLPVAMALHASNKFFASSLPSSFSSFLPSFLPWFLLSFFPSFLRSLLTSFRAPSFSHSLPSFFLSSFLSSSLLSSPLPSFLQFSDFLLSFACFMLCQLLVFFTSCLHDVSFQPSFEHCIMDMSVHRASRQ